MSPSRLCPPTTGYIEDEIDDCSEDEIDETPSPQINTQVDLNLAEAEQSSISMSFEDMMEEFAAYQAPSLPLTMPISVIPFRPFKQLPFEIVQEICLACLDDDEYPPVDPAQAPLLLMQISSDVRHIAASTPALWNGIYVHCADVPRRYGEEATRQDMERMATMSDMFEQRTVIVGQWLARSGSLPLKILIKGTFEVNNTVYKRFLRPAVENLVSLITDFADRWEKVGILLPRFSFPCVEKLRGSDVPMLHSLWISMYSTKLQLVDAPRLAVLNITHFDKSDILVWPANLTCISINEGSHWEVSDLRKLLQLSIQVVECILDCWTDVYTSEDEFASLDVISLPLLKSLTLGVGVTHLVLCLDTPSLETLDLGTWMFTTTLTPILDKVPNLTCLRIHVFRLAELEQILPHCPSLTTLQVSGNFPVWNISDEVAEDTERLGRLHHIISPKLVDFSKVDTSPRWSSGY